MKNLTCLSILSLAWLTSFAASTIGDLKVTPVEPLGVAIDYTVSGATAEDANSLLEVSMTAGGVTYVARNLAGATNFVDGAHRVYWNMAKDGLAVDPTTASLSVKCVHPPYCVVDLSGGPSAAEYPVTYLYAALADGFNTEEYKTTKLVLKCVEAGSFEMQGSTTVTLTKPFYMGLFEMTQKQWSLVTGSNPSYFSGDTRPVDQVSYNMIRGSPKGANWPASSAVDPSSFLGKLRTKTGLDFDLPTEAQWEYACRAGTTTTYSYGDRADGGYMWDYTNSNSQTHEVGTKKPNPWGFYDMHGNVWEWCLDWDGTLTYGTDPKGSSSGSVRVIRGGSWGSSTAACTSSYRSYGSPLYGHDTKGFRLSRTLP